MARPQEECLVSVMSATEVEYLENSETELQILIEGAPDEVLVQETSCTWGVCDLFEPGLLSLRTLFWEDNRTIRIIQGNRREDVNKFIITQEDSVISAKTVYSCKKKKMFKNTLQEQDDDDEATYFVLCQENRRIKRHPFSSSNYSSRMRNTCCEKELQEPGVQEKT